MSAPADHADLIARLEAATGPDRWLDAAIVVALDIRPDWLKRSRGELWIDDRGAVLFRDECIKRRGPGNPSLRDCDVLHYTASIDAALPGEDICSIEKQKQLPGQPIYWVAVHEPPRPGAMSIAGRGRTAALACRIAALKARAAAPRSSMGGAQQDLVHERASPAVTPIGQER